VGLPNFLGTAYYLTYGGSYFVGTFIWSIGTKAHENVANTCRGRIVRESRKFSGHPCMAHCAVIFAIAQLSCYTKVDITR